MLLEKCDLIGLRCYVIMHQAGFACLESSKVMEFERQVSISGGNVAVVTFWHRELSGDALIVFLSVS